MKPWRVFLPQLIFCMGFVSKENNTQNILIWILMFDTKKCFELMKKLGICPLYTFIDLSVCSTLSSILRDSLMRFLKLVFFANNFVLVSWEIFNLGSRFRIKITLWKNCPFNLWLLICNFQARRIFSHIKCKEKCWKCRKR